MIKTTPFDAAYYLDNDESVAFFIADALTDNDPEYVIHGIGIAARAYGMTQLAKLAGISRDDLYEALRADDAPNKPILLGLIKALGFDPAEAMTQVQDTPPVRSKRRTTKKTTAIPRARRPAKSPVEA